MSIKMTEERIDIVLKCSNYLVDVCFEEMLRYMNVFMLPVRCLWYIEMFFEEDAKEDFKGVYEQIFTMNLNRILKNLGKEEIYK